PAPSAWHWGPTTTSSAQYPAPSSPYGRPPAVDKFGRHPPSPARSPAPSPAPEWLPLRPRHPPLPPWFCKNLAASCGPPGTLSCRITRNRKCSPLKPGKHDVLEIEVW